MFRTLLPATAVALSSLFAMAPAAAADAAGDAAPAPWYAVARCDAIQPHIQTCKANLGKSAPKGYDSATCANMLESYNRWSCALVLASATSSATKDDLKPKVEQMAAAPVDSSKWLFVLAVENYESTDKVAYAKNSGELVVKAFQKRFGVSPRNTYALIDDKATTAAFLDKMNAMLANVKFGDTVYFYYSGHGIPDQNTQEAFILPRDKMVNYVAQEDGLKLSNIYDQLAKSPASRIYAFVDSCFSGRTDNKSNFTGVAPGLFRAREYAVDNRMTVITAGKHTQFSNAYAAKGHRMFSYFLVKSLLQQRSPTTPVGDIYKDVYAGVLNASNELGDSYRQEPQILGNAEAPLFQ